MTSGSLAPRSIEARAGGTIFGVAFGGRFLVLLSVGMLWLGPALFDARFLYALALWDAVLVVAWALDAWRLPQPAALAVRRSWLSLLELSVPARLQLTVVNHSSSVVRATVVDAVPRTLRPEPSPLVFVLQPTAESTGLYEVVPRERGEIAIGDAYIRYRSWLGFAERWSRAPLSQPVIVYPNLDEAKRGSVYLVPSRQIELERRSQRIRGSGRSFESLRDHRDGDDLRDICWTASARRAKLVSRLYESEKSQPIWLVLDSGRLMRGRVDRLSKLDHAVNAALTLSRVALGSGDRVGLLAYSRQIDHRLPAARGSAHLRQMVAHLAEVRAGEAEADHIQAAGRLLGDQKRRSLIVWMTDVPDTAMTPDVVTAAATLMSRHLVVFVVIGQSDLQRVAARKPENVEDMFETAAAQEVAHRRSLLIAQLRAKGALAIETTTSFSALLVNMYLEIKLRGRL
ncbi:MAG TPA: DUF58 domain-containing protein [Vicinamibacterales bacterium]